MYKSKLSEEERQERKLARYRRYYERRREDPEFRARNAERMREWNAKNPRNVKHQDLQKRYGWTIEGYEQMLIEQTGVCAACGRPETRMLSGKLLALAVDHDHDTGQVRGLLCSKCNVVLGMARESVDGLICVMEYLWRWEERKEAERVQLAS